MKHFHFLLLLSDLHAFDLGSFKNKLLFKKAKKDVSNKFGNFQVFIYDVTPESESTIPIEFETFFDAPIYATFQLCGKEIYYSPNGIQAVPPLMTPFGVPKDVMKKGRTNIPCDEFLGNIPKWNETRFSGDKYDPRNYNNNLFVDIMSFYLTGEAVGLAYWSEFLPTITKNFITETFDFLGADAVGWKYEVEQAGEVAQKFFVQTGHKFSAFFSHLFQKSQGTFKDLKEDMPEKIEDSKKSVADFYQKAKEKLTNFKKTDSQPLSTSLAASTSEEVQSVTENPVIQKPFKTVKNFARSSAKISVLEYLLMITIVLIFK